MKLQYVGVSALMLGWASSANAGNGLCMFNQLHPEAKEYAYRLYEQGGLENFAARFRVPDSELDAAGQACNVSPGQRDQAERAQNQYLAQYLLERSVQDNHRFGGDVLRNAFQLASPGARSAIRSFALARRTNPTVPVPTAAFNEVFYRIPLPHTELLKERVIKAYITAVIAAYNDGETYGG